MAGKNDDNESAGRFSPRRILAHLFAEHGSLKQKAIRSSLWALLGNGISQLATLVRMVVLARLLSPNDFGVMAVAAMVLSGLDAFTQTGYQAALIQRPGDIRGHLNTAFSIQALRGFVLAGLLYTLAPFIAAFFHNVEATPVIRVVSIAVLIQGFVNPAIVFFQKELNFKRQVFWNLSEALTGLVVGVVLAFILRNVWALVGAFIASAIARTSVSFVMHPYRPRPRIDWRCAWELTRFGRWVFGTNILAYLSSNLDLAVVGRILGTVGLGFYQMAYRISNLPATVMVQIFSNVAFPLYAKVQADKQKLNRIFFLGLDIVLLMGLPVALFFAILAKPLVVVVLGEKWLPAAVGLQILAFYGFLRMVVILGGELFVGIGHPACGTKLNIFRFVALAVLVYPLTHQWGLVGAAAAAVCSMAVSLPYWLVRCAGFLDLSPGHIIRNVLRGLMPVLFGCAAPLVLFSILLPVQQPWALLLTMGITALIYSAMTFSRLRAVINASVSARGKTEDSP